MKVVLLLILVLLTALGWSQSTWHKGISFQLGTSTIINVNKENGKVNELESPNYSLKPSFGLGLKTQYNKGLRWTYFLQSNYQQRGAIFDRDFNDGPSYKFNYLDCVLGTSYELVSLAKNKHLQLRTGIYSSLLLNAFRANSIEMVNLGSEINRFDAGWVVATGLDLPRLNTDEVQITLFGQLGFFQLFRGSFMDNGLTGNNLIFGFQMDYLFGKSKNKPTTE